MRVVNQRRGGRNRQRGEKVEVVPNYGGQGGNDYIVLEHKKGYYMIIPESEDDVKELMRQAHVLDHNFRTEEGR